MELGSILPYLISAVVIFGAIAFVLMLSGRKGRASSGEKKQKSLQKKQLQEIRDAQKRLAKDPHDPAGLMPVSDMYYANHIWDKAYPMYCDLANLSLNNTSIEPFKAHLRAGVCAVQLDKPKEALQYLTSAYKINPYDFDLNFNMGVSCYKLQMLDKAIPCFKKAITVQPEAQGVNIYLGKCLYESHHYRESLGYLKKALTEEPGNKEALYYMADAMTQEGHSDKALKVFLHLRADPEFGARSCLNAGLCHLKTNAEDEAIQDFEIGLKHQSAPQDVKMELQYNLGRTLLGKNQLSKGLEYLKAIRMVNASYKDVNNLIGRYQELSQNMNLNTFLSGSNGDFVALCRKFVAVKYKNSHVKILDVNVGANYTDITADVDSPRSQDSEVFRFFRTTGATGELFLRDLHAMMKDTNIDRGFCITAGTFSEEAHKFIEGRPIDLIEKPELVKVLKLIP